MSVLPPDDDRTMLALPSADTGAAPAAPHAPVHENDGNALREGARVFEFEITRVIGVGGFGIVYLAYDHSLQRKIALKEYMPSSLAERTSALQVAVKSERHAETFDAGMRSFINEARLLAQFDHPSLVKVYRFWEANGTAYMVMPFYEGLTLKQTLKARTAPPDEAWLKNLLAPLLDAIETLHKEQCFHRDIAPDNILMLAEDRPLLLDFGAARRAITGMDQAFTVILKPGYAPIEQYSDVAAMTQGPWTDIYALASVVHFAINGRAPVPSVTRMISDTQVSLAECAAGRYSAEFLETIDQCLAVKPQDRLQSVGALREQLSLAPVSKQSMRSRGAQAHAFGSETASGNVDNGEPGNRRRSMLISAAVAAMILAAAGVFLVKGSGTFVPNGGSPASPRIIVETAQPTTAVSQTRAPAPSPTPLPAKSAVATSDVQPAPPGAAELAQGPINAEGILGQIYDARNPDHTVNVTLPMNTVRIRTKDRLRMSITSSRPGYVYLLMVGTNHKDFNLLFPNTADKKNRIAAGEAMQLPRSNWSLGAFGPPGTDRFIAIVSDMPRQFDKAGLKTGDLFGEFPVELTSQAPRVAAGAAPAFAGSAVCRSDAPKSECSQSYGAARFSIDEVSAK